MTNLETTKLEHGYFPEASKFVDTLREIKDLRQTHGWDVIMSTLDITAENGTMRISTPIGDVVSMEPTEWAHGQIANKMGITKQYYDKIRAEPQKALFDYNVNYWMHNYEKKVLVRRFNDKMIALLSDRYRAYDNYDVANIVMHTVMEMGIKNVKTDHMLLSDKMMSFSVYDPTPENMLALPDAPHDKYMLGLKVKNSDVGYSSFEMSPMLVRLVCTNGMVSFNPYRKIHRGGSQDEGNIWSNETNRARAALNGYELRDITRLAFNKSKALEYLGELRQLQNIHVDPTQQDIYMPIFSLTQEESENVWKRVEQNNAYEDVQAVTSYANDLISAGRDRGAELQENTTDPLQKFQNAERQRQKKERSSNDLSNFEVKIE